MAYDEGLAQRLREVFDDQPGLSERRMFGGLAFMINGHMCCGVTGEALMLRVGPDQHQAALTQPYVRPMDFTGKPMKGFVYVETEGLETDEGLAAWVEWGKRFVLSLPPK